MGRVRPQNPRQPKGPWFKTLEWIAQKRPYTWFMINVGDRIDPPLMKLTGGRVKTTLNSPTVVMTHRGAKSGKLRETPLAYFTDGDDVILISSKGGAEHNPAWYHNVKANPEIELKNGGGGGRYRAREAEGAERERLWELANEMYSGFTDYQTRTARRIPVLVCSPIDDLPG